MSPTAFLTRTVKTQIVQDYKHIGGEHQQISNKI